MVKVLIGRQSNWKAEDCVATNVFLTFFIYFFVLYRYKRGKIKDIC